MENRDVTDTSFPTADEKKAAVRDLASRSLRMGILSLVIPFAAYTPVSIIWLLSNIPGIFSRTSAVDPSNYLASFKAFYGPVFSSYPLWSVLLAVCLLPGIILGRIAWKRGNLARAGAVDLGIRVPAKAIVGKILGIVAFFYSIVNIASCLFSGILYGFIGKIL